MDHFILKFPESARKLYELPEVVEFEFTLRVQEAFALKRELDLGWEQLRAMLFNLVDAAGKVRATDSDARLAGLGVVYWLAVRRLGRAVKWADFEVDVFAVDWEWVNDPNQQAPEGASTS